MDNKLFITIQIFKIGLMYKNRIMKEIHGILHYLCPTQRKKRKAFENRDPTLKREDARYFIILSKLA